MKILVCGSRDWTDSERIHTALVCALDTLDPRAVTVIHGAALGADALGVRAARQLGIATEAHPADRQTHGRRAGILRNLTMLDQRPDLVLAFQRNGSRGTQHTIDEARKRGIPVEVYTAEERQAP